MTQSTDITFNSSLMAHYGQSGPRYTSYSTAIQFRQSIDAQEYHLAAANSAGAMAQDPLALYLNVPFCFSPCFYCGCNKIVTHRLEDADDVVRKDVIHQIMCHGVVDTAFLDLRHRIHFKDYFADELRRLEALRTDGLVVVSDEHIMLTPTGRLMMRTVAMTFDAYLAQGAAPLAMSRVV